MRAVYLWEETATKFDYLRGLASGQPRVAVVLPKGATASPEHFTSTLEKALGDDGTGLSGVRVNYSGQPLPLSDASGFLVMVQFTAAKLPMPYVQEDVPGHLLQSMGRLVSQSRNGDTASRVFEQTRSRHPGVSGRTWPTCGGSSPGRRPIGSVSSSSTSAG